MKANAVVARIVLVCQLTIQLLNAVGIIFSNDSKLQRKEWIMVFDCATTSGYDAFRSLAFIEGQTP